jgi:two-component system, OmpR family, response regulator
MRILIIEDDPILSRNINDALNAERMQTESVFDGLLAERILRKDCFDCIIMDINLPGKSGYDLCAAFRAYNRETPVLMLTAFSELEDKIKGFDQGADDYLTKPFFMRELILRVNSLIKRSKYPLKSQGPDSIIADDIIIHPAQKKVFRQGNEISLTPREYQVLLLLTENKGEIVSKNELIKEIWGTSFNINTNTIEVYMNFLRNKLDKPFGKNTIKTKVGYGYFLDIK